MRGKITPRQMWVPIAIHRYQGDSAEIIHLTTGISKTTIHQLLNTPEYKAAEQRIFDALDMEQLNVHSLVKHAAEPSLTLKQSVSDTPETESETPELDLGEVPTQM